MPILGLLEDLRLNVMIRLANRRCVGLRWKSKVGPRIAKLLKKNADRSHEYAPRESSNNRFQIQGRGVSCQSGVISTHDVDLNKRNCTCRRWNISGLPCPHAICAIFSKGLKPEDFVDVAYSQKKYMLAYGPAINPILGVEEWDVIEKPILSLQYTRGPGRPKFSRNKEPDEQRLPPPGTTKPPSGTEKLPRAYYQGITCGRCHKKGHNSRTCARREAQSQTRIESPPSQNYGNDVHVDQASHDDNVQPNTTTSMQQDQAHTHISFENTLIEEVHIQTPSSVGATSSQPLFTNPSMSQVYPHPQSSSQPSVIGSSSEKGRLRQTKSPAKKQIPMRIQRNKAPAPNERSQRKPNWKP
ncbi:uncharacterized protein LOC112180897 [Rosa chinensis]|nr:uncharacterized protein LOC112180897 [Rosa chinensis]